MSNLTYRILVALVAIPAIIFITLQGGWIFLFFILLLTVLGMREFYSFAEMKGIQPIRWLGIFCGINLVAMFYSYTANDISLFPILESGFFILLLIAGIIELFRNKPSPLGNLSTTFFGILYVAGCFGALVGLREMNLMAHPNANSYIIISLFATIWICDSSAFFVGKFIGKHKLFARVSPKKTWEGAIAGLLMAVLFSIVARNNFLRFISIYDAIILGMIVGVIGQTGDLFESLLKREAEVKDSSTIIPGHGGVLDRFDSLLFVAPVVYVYFKVIS